MAIWWISLNYMIPSWTLATSLIGEGLTWFEALLCIFVANVLVSLACVATGQIGNKYGIPFPVLTRASFGLYGANVPCIFRALAACGWFGIQTYVGGMALYTAVLQFSPQVSEWPYVANLGIGSGPLLFIVLFWFLNLLVADLGPTAILRISIAKVATLPALACVLVGLCVKAAGGLGPLFESPSTSYSAPEKARLWLRCLNSQFAFWSTIALNISDFTRHCSDQKSHTIGSIFLPISITLCALQGVVVTSTSLVIWGEAVTDFVGLASHLQSPAAVCVAAFLQVFMTLGTNVPANAVAPAYCFSNLLPRLISYRTGAMIAALISITVMPWKLLADSATSSATLQFLNGSGIFLTAALAVIVVDYHVFSHRHLNLADLYRQEGVYRYFHGFNPVAFLSIFAGITPCVPGLVQTDVAPASDDTFSSLYHYSCFISFAISSTTYLSFTYASRSPAVLAILRPVFARPIRSHSASTPVRSAVWVVLTRMLSRLTSVARAIFVGSLALSRPVWVRLGCLKETRDPPTARTQTLRSKLDASVKGGSSSIRGIGSMKLVKVRAKAQPNVQPKVIGRYHPDEHLPSGSRRGVGGESESESGSESDSSTDGPASKGGGRGHAKNSVKVPPAAWRDPASSHGHVEKRDRLSTLAQVLSAGDVVLGRPNRRPRDVTAPETNEDQVPAVTSRPAHVDDTLLDRTGSDVALDKEATARLPRDAPRQGPDLMAVPGTWLQSFARP